MVCFVCSDCCKNRRIVLVVASIYLMWWSSMSILLYRNFQGIVFSAEGG